MQPVRTVNSDDRNSLRLRIDTQKQCWSANSEILSAPLLSLIKDKDSFCRQRGCLKTLVGQKLILKAKTRAARKMDPILTDDCLINT